jgi:hypothetical protein
MEEDSSLREDPASLEEAGEDPIVEEDLTLF